MTNSPTNTIPNTTSRVNHFTGLARRRRKFSLLPANGDGSTLTLDFTTGQLDPRLTFSRTSNATFINSGGLVEWANANMMTRSQSQDNNSYWNDFGTSVTRTSGQTDPFGGTGAVKLVYNAISAAVVISRTVSVSQGLPYTLSIWMRADSGTVNNIRLGRAASASGAFTPTLTTTWQRYSLSFVATTASDGIELRLLFKGTPDTATFHVFGAQLEPGSTMRDYNPALLDVPYQAPRFDHDPTTLAPKGLLIEGTATSLSRSSQDLTNATYWTLQTAYASTSATGGTAPDGTNTGNLFTEPSSNLQRSIYQSYSSAAGTYTFSVWLKAGSGSTRYMRLVVSSGASDFGYVTVNMSTGAIQQAAAVVGTATNASATVSGNYTATGWRRYSLTVTLAASVNFVFLVPTDLASIDTPTTNYGRVSYLGDGSSFLIWGAQLEAGSGASSYIPTGGSTVQRLADICYIPDGDHSWFTSKNNCVLFMQCEIPRTSNFGNLMYLGQWSGGEYSYGHQVYAFPATAVSANAKINAATSADQVLFGNQSVPINLKIAMCPNSDAARLARAWNGTASETTGLTPTASRFPAWTQQARFGIGTNAISLGSSTACNIYVRTVKFFPFAMSNAQLQSLTT